MALGFELRSVSKTYDGITAVSDASLRIGDGERLAIIGPSGCGKSTILRLLAGIEAPSSGQILLDGSVVSESGRVILPPYRRGVAMVFQDLALWPNLSVLGNIKLALAGQRLSKQVVLSRASKALSLCKIEHLVERRPGALSGGQQQRVALARALASTPRYLFLDEPFSGLDLVTKATLLREIEELVAAEKVTLVLVTHDPAEATTLCQSAILMDEGRIQESGSIEHLLRDSKAEILRVFKHVMERLPSPHA